MQYLTDFIRRSKQYYQPCLLQHITDEVKVVLKQYNFTLKELCYRIKYNIPLDKVFVCEYCGKPIKYHNSRHYTRFCCQKCAVVSLNKSQEHIEKVKKTTQEHYGVDNYAKTDEYKIKRERACMKKYGVASHNKVDSCKQKARLTCIELYNTPWYASTQECKDRIRATKKENGTFNTSSSEEEAYMLLVNKFGINNVKRQYKSKDYPFNCDFYIKSLNLYIEYNGMFTHGKEPYDPNNPEHIKILNFWQSKNTDFYRSAIHTWTISDPLKYKTAKDNKLNYKIFWNVEEVRNWINSLT